MNSKVTHIKRGNLTITLALRQIGNQSPYFSATAEERNPRTGRIEACGAMHDAILAAAPELADFVALHLSDVDGLPLHAKANGYYWLAGALGGLGERYHGGNSSPERSPEECLKVFADYMRITPEQADALIDAFRGGKGAVREQFEAWADAQRPRWKLEADAVIAKYLNA